MPAKIKSPAMTAPTTMPTIAPEPRLGSLLSVGWLVGKGGGVIPSAVSVVEAEVAEVDIEGNNVEVDGTEMLGTDGSKELEILFNWSSGVA